MLVVMTPADGRSGPADRPDQPETRGERKERTRRAIMEAALTLCEDSSLVALSLRQVAKEVGIVPTAFYRHFDSIEDLGLALVEDSFVSLREMLRDVRHVDPQAEFRFRDIIDQSVSVLLEHTRHRNTHFAFISREWRAGPPAVREAVAHQIELVERELATDLSRLTPPSWTHRDLRVLSNLIVTLSVGTTEALLGTRPSSSAESEIAERARTQLRMLLVGAFQWHAQEE